MKKLVKKNKGFTLVEILVVIAIIGILAIVALPALFKNIEKAKIVDLEADISAMKSAVRNIYAETSINDYHMDIRKDENGKLYAGLKFGNYTDMNKEEELFIKEIESLEMPFGNMYTLKSASKDGNQDESTLKDIDLIIYLETNISEEGIEKLEKDLGEKAKLETDAKGNPYITIRIYRK